MKADLFVQLFHLEQTPNGFIAARNTDSSQASPNSLVPVLEPTRGAAKALAGESKMSEGSLSADGTYSYVKGARIRGKWIDGSYYTGTIMAVTDIGEYKILFDDGDSLILPYHHLRPPKLRPDGASIATSATAEEAQVASPSVPSQPSRSTGSVPAASSASPSSLSLKPPGVDRPMYSLHPSTTPTPASSSSAPASAPASASTDRMQQ